MLLSHAHKCNTSLDTMLANYNNCSEVDLGSDEVGEDTAEVTDDTNSATAHKRPREELASHADTAAVLGTGNGSTGTSRDDSAATALEVKSLADTLQLATQSITTVVEQLAKVAKRQAEAADRLAAAPSAHHQHQPRLLEQQQTSMRGQLTLQQQQMFWQQHWLHQQQSSWQHYY
eukprot:3936-Heterococcus_DN1.PRE.9